MADEKNYQPFPLGVKGRPFPMMMPATTVKTDEGNVFVPPHLGALEDPVVVSSRRSYQEMMGLAYRNMPAPGMLRVFYDGLALRSPESERRAQFTLGAPGVGKSFLSKHMAKMRDERGAIVIDCGNRNLDELVFETILDTEKGKSLFQKIEAKAIDGSLNSASIKILKDGLGAGFSQEGDKLAFDWEAVGKSSGEKDAEKASEKLEKAMEALKQVCELEGMQGESDGIGLKTREGPIIQAWKEGRELVLDEYNKGKQGTDSGLQTLWQVIIGEEKETTVKGGAGQSFTFNRKDMKEGFFVTLTGNGTEDGMATQELSESAYSRLRPDFIPPLDVADWQHRICQTITDVPISTLYNCSEEQWRQNPKDFGSFVEKIQTLGRSEKEQDNIPELKRKMVKNWQGVLEASAKIAKFYDQWSKLVDPNNEKLPPELSMEVDEGYKIQTGVGMRMMMAHLAKATKGMPEVVSPENSSGFNVNDDWNVVPKFTQKAENPGAKYGTQLSRVILEEIDKTTRGRGKHNLHKSVMKLAADCGIIEASFEEASKSGQKTISDLLDLDKVKQEVKVTDKTLETQQQFCDFLRGKYEGLSPKNDDIVSAVEIEQGVNALLNEKDTKEKSAIDRYLVLPNPQFMESSSGQATPFMLVPTIDAMPTRSEVENDNYKNRDVGGDELLNHETFLKSLAMPSIGKSNMNSLWNQAITDAIEITSSDDESVAIAQKESKDGLATITVVCGKNDSGEEAVMNVLLKEKGSVRMALVTGEADVSKETSQLLAKEGITFVELGKQDSLQKINKALTQMVGEGDERKKIEEPLVAAHRHRNASTPENADLATAMTSTKTTSPVYLLNKAKGR